VSSMLVDDPIVYALYHSSMPFVLVGRHPTLNVSYVDVDNINGARSATAHLIGLGRRRIATITGPQNMIAGIDRLQGYREALEAHGLPILPDLIAEGDFSEQSGFMAMQKLLPAQPDAVFVASDTMALGAMRALHRAGLRIPQDVAVIGFDDIPPAARFDPPLTTVRQPIHEMGYQA
ncbi:substrate-binding domain-containing protein, partial [Thermoflexus sp.]|uniref:substrate-binding domain-containing protein n=1 Tax=Thermoflexus sp. TaxID=1969742 RepID=UPI0026041EDD